ncbi:hypothetical protein [Streptomyces sp. NPDC014793]
MLLQTMGAVLPAALAVALSSFPLAVLLGSSILGDGLPGLGR